MFGHPARPTIVASARIRRRIALLFTLLAILGALTFLRTPLVALAHAAHTERAASGGPVVNWASNMIYAGQNNGNPEGPVGELAGVVGSGFTVGASVNLILAPGDSASNPAVCQSGAIPLGSDITVQNDGTFNFSFTWPNAANSGDYSVCALNPSDGSVLTGADGGPFHVLSANQPAIQVSRSSVAAGDTLTITGSNWLPPQPVSVFIGTYHNCDASPIVHATPGSDGSGAFAVQLTVPLGTAPGSYVASAFTTNNDVLDVGLTSGSIPLAITAAAATATPQVSATPTRQSGSTSVGGYGGAPTTTSADNTPYIIAIIVAGVALLLALVGLGAYLLLRRRRGAAVSAAGVAGGAALPAAGGAYVAPGSPPVGMSSPNTPPDWRVLPNWNATPTEFLPGGAVAAPVVPSAPTPLTPTPPQARPSPSTPGAQGPSAPLTQSTQPALPTADPDAPTLPGHYPD